MVEISLDSTDDQARILLNLSAHGETMSAIRHFTNTTEAQAERALAKLMERGLAEKAMIPSSDFFYAKPGEFSYRLTIKGSALVEEERAKHRRLMREESGK
jgi:DNA-binding MarR family transcriptional regulator